MKLTVFMTLAGLALFASIAFGQSFVEMKTISGGTFVPLYGSDSTGVTVTSFKLDVYPVTNAEFLTFVKENAKWQRSQVLGLFADDNYLSQWAGDLQLDPQMNPDSPVTSVSWFAAKAYCECEGKRLATMDEWEFAAMSSPTAANAQEDSVFNQWIIEGYETPRTSIKKIGRNPQNFWGIHDLHGLVWEWTSDFNSVLISGESRKDGDNDSSLFCAGGAVGASDLMNYAAFMRYAFRGSIKANFSVRTLGFRCAQNVDE
ncbi:MAG: sulfatase modifying factor 1 [Candidatus Krumholzibacteriia bacterium]|jgi:sulfatase modifying factor 1